MTVNYRISGPEDAPPLVLAHSLATDHHMWDRLVPLLEPEFRVIRYDARGHGLTPAGGTAFSMAGLQDDVIALLDHLGISQAHFVGLSMGAMVGLGLGLDHPHRLLGLVVCDARSEMPVATRATWDERIAQVRAGGVETQIEPTLARWFTEAFLSDTASMDWMRSVIRSTSIEGYTGCARALQDFDVGSRLGEMRVPTLYLTGERDASAPPGIVKAMHERTPGSAFVAIANAAHLTAVEQPGAVGTAIADFLGALPAKRAA